MAIELPLNIDKYKDWLYKQIIGLKIIEGVVLELIRDRLAIFSKPRDSIKDLFNLI